MPASPEAPPTTTGSGLAVAAGLTSVVLWASAFVGIRDAGRELSPGALTLARLTIGAVVLGAVMLARCQPLPGRADWPGIALCGVLWFGAYNVLLNSAERLVDAGTAAMLVNTGPVFIALLAGWLLGEGFPSRLFAGMAIALAGAVVIGWSVSTGDGATPIGALLCLGAALAYAGGVVAQKPLLARLSALQVTWSACLVGAVVCLPFAGQLAADAAEASPRALAWAIYLGVFPTAVAFTTWAYALARTTAGRMGALTYLVPPMAVVLGWLILGEATPALALAGGALCLAGVWWARRP